MDVGPITVWLGMSKDELIKDFNDANYSITDQGDAVFALLGSHAYGPIWFKNGRLVFAQVDWFKEGTQEVDAVLGALAALTQKTSGQCVISHQPMSTPDSSSDRIFAVCGNRSVLIGHGKIQNSPFVSVTERIGELPAQSN